MLKGPFFIIAEILSVKKSYRLIIATAWFLFISFLFFLPGNDLPSDSWLDKIPFFDKLVHVGFFFVLIWLWLWAYGITNSIGKFKMFLLIAVAYGLMVEFIQLWFVAGRSFDLLDWTADSIGTITGGFLRLAYTQKIDPCRNRGRNQN